MASSQPSFDPTFEQPYGTGNEGGNGTGGGAQDVGARNLSHASFDPERSGMASSQPSFDPDFEPPAASQQVKVLAPCTPHPAPETLNPKPCTPHSAPCTLHPAP